MRVCQCWDDGNVDDIRLIAILRRHGAKGSFNLNAGLHRAERHHAWTYQQVKPVWKLAAGELRAVYDGFLAANHTLTHPHLTKLGDAEVAREIGEGRAALERIFGYPVLGFAYPFGDHDARVMEAVRAAGHVYARTCAITDDVGSPADPMTLHSSCHHAAADFWQRYERAKAADGVFYFWGHSYEFLDEPSWQAFEAKIARISADPAAKWVDLPGLFADARA
jgi:peptidoglycan/xylan/chitin deacetylase (PgdA/CDA1 family)